jgi:hypothetical protein
VSYRRELWLPLPCLFFPVSGFQEQAEKDKKKNEEIFREWAKSRVQDAVNLNFWRGPQLRLLFYPDQAGIVGRCGGETGGRQ